MSSSFARRARRALRHIAGKPGDYHGLVLHADGCRSPEFPCTCDPGLVIVPSTPGNEAWIEAHKRERREKIRSALS